MSTGSKRNKSSSLPEEVAELREQWRWFFSLGLGLVTFGIIAITSPIAFTMTTAALFGILLLVGGLAQIISSIWSPKWGGVLPQLLMGIRFVRVAARGTSTLKLRNNDLLDAMAPPQSIRGVQWFGGEFQINYPWLVPANDLQGAQAGAGPFARSGPRPGRSTRLRRTSPARVVLRATPRRAPRPTRVAGRRRKRPARSRPCRAPSS